MIHAAALINGAATSIASSNRGRTPNQNMA